MAYIQAYKKLNQLIENETLEPLVKWGFRMALSGTLPVIWGLHTGRVMDSVWIALTAEGVSWVELKGGFAWRVRTLMAGSILALLFSFLGSVTGPFLGLSLVAIFAVGFLATLLKNVGDRASGLALCVYMMFIFCNAYPSTSAHELRHRMILIAIGAVWPLITGITISFLSPAEEPFRRQIALIWRAIAALSGAIAQNNLDNTRGNTGWVFREEKDVRAAIDNSYQFYGKMAHQVRPKNNSQRQLALLRKVAGMVSVNIISIGEEMSVIDTPDQDERLRIKLTTLLSAFREAMERIAVFLISLEPEEKLLVITQLNRIRKLIDLTREYPLDETSHYTTVKRILQLMERSVRLLENALLRIDQMGSDAPVFRSYSFIKTLFVLNPKYFFSDLRMVFDFTTLNMRYALRSAFAVTIGLFIYKWFQIDHGYWIPFSLMIVIQPYFGATFNKAIDRVVGTTLGGIAGSLLLHMPTGIYLKEIVLFLTFILMVYFIKKKYSIAVFFITLNLVLLFRIEASYNDSIMIYRALCTLMGSLLAVVAGFALFPTWDRKWLPAHLAAAIYANYEYFIGAFYAARRNVNWTKPKRNAETKNSNVFDSFNRYIQEPGAEKPGWYYDLLTSNVRITRDINSIQLEEDEKQESTTKASPEQQQKINECLNSFNKVVTHLKKLDPGIRATAWEYALDFESPFHLNQPQMVYLEKLNIELKTMIQWLMVND